MDRMLFVGRVDPLFNALAGPPEPVTAEPRPEPVDPLYLGPGEERCRHPLPGGGSLYYLVKTAEILTWDEDEYRIDGRKRMRKVGSKRVTWPVTYCPLAWRPDPGFVTLADDIVREWRRALTELARRLRAAQLTAHRLAPATAPER